MSSPKTLLFISVIAAMTSMMAAQRTPTISYVTPNISTTRSSTIDMDCSVLWATEYPILWMKIDELGRPIPLARGPSLIIRDHRYINSLIESALKGSGLGLELSLTINISLQ